MKVGRDLIELTIFSGGSVFQELAELVHSNVDRANSYERLCNDFDEILFERFLASCQLCNTCTIDTLQLQHFGSDAIVYVTQNWQC
jgi:hypothetical protein